MAANPVTTEALRSALAVAASLLVLVIGPAEASDWFDTAFSSHLKTLELIDSMNASVIAGRAAERGAVMAETDEESEELAAETRRHSEDVERQGSELQAIFVERGWSKEKGLLDEFDRSWQDSRKLDAEILALAVRNTNLKAARLSQGRGIELLRRFMEELPGIGRKADGQDGSTLAGPACKAIQAAQMIQILHAPHIAEAESARMDQIEGEIRALDGEVRRGLEELKRGATSGEMKKVAAAGATYDEYAQVTREVVADSRQNTNVLSMALSMGQKRKVTARCMEILQSMRELVSKHEFKGTR